MASTWSFCAVFCAAVFCARALPLADTILEDHVKTIVAHVDDYLATHGFNELFLPDIGLFSFDPIKLRNGGFGQFSTIYVQGATAANKTLPDNGTLYSFDIELGLNELKVHYDFDISTVVLKQKGNFSLSLLKNSARLTGSVSILSNKVCAAKLTGVEVVELDNYRIELPEDTPVLVFVSELILNAVTPKLVPLLNTALQGALLVPGAQNVFSAIACSQLS